MRRPGSKSAVPAMAALATALLLAKVDGFLPQTTNNHMVQLSSKTKTNDANLKGSIILKASDSTNTEKDGAAAEKKDFQPVILEAFPEAADPNYINRGPVGEGDFIISREGEPTAEELANENILRIVLSESTDLEVNTLVWKGLGYRFDPEKEEWNNSECFPKWKEKYPTPPDFIGMQRMYSREIDVVSLRSNQALVKSVPMENKQGLKAQMKPLGWKGFQYKELTPNLTRRAQCANWLIFYRDELFGYTLEELKERRQRKREAEELAKQKEDKEDEWSPPIREVY